MDPGLAKLVRLPLFSDGFEDLLTELGYGSVEVFLAFGQLSDAQFVLDFLNTALVFLPGEKRSDAELNVLRKRLERHVTELGMLWQLIQATKDNLLAREARLQMFGLSFASRSRPSSAPPAPKVPKLAAASSTSIQPLRTGLCGLASHGKGDPCEIEVDP